MNELIAAAAQRAANYLAALDARPVYPTAEATEPLERLDTALPERPTDPAATLALLDEIGSPATVATAGRRYFGFVTGGSLPATVAAQMLATAWDQNVGLEVMSPVGAALEGVTARWLVDVLGLPPGAEVSLVTGATMANFTALAAARNAVLTRAGWDVEADGLFGAPPVAVVVSDEVHVTVLKALGMLGFGKERVVRVPTDDQGRMRAEALPQIDSPAIICLQAGNVNSGAFDPAPEIVTYARARGAWVHVDGAFGLWAAAAPRLRRLTEGIAEADSWATDAHKWLNVPYDCGIAFVRDGATLRAAMAARAAYLLEGGRREPMHYTPESSRRARAVEVWAALHSLGRSGLAALIERCCAHAQRFATGLSAAGYSVLNEVFLNQVLASFGDDETTRRVIAGVQQEGTCWAGGTHWHGRAAMRISVSSWATTEEDVEKSLTAIVRVARSL